MFVFFTIIFLIVSQIFSLSLNYPKCCDLDSSMFQQNSKYNCSTSKDKRIQFSSNIANSKTNNSVQCVELLESHVKLFEMKYDSEIRLIDTEISENFHSKCCPLGFHYEIDTHSCIKLNTNQIVPIGFIKIGLPKCEIITDKFFDNANELMNYLRLLKDDYCQDVVSTGNQFVVRICKTNYDVCKQMRCLRKCCPDGQSFIGGQFCQDTYEYGINLTAAKNIRKPNDSFALVHGFQPRVILLPQWLKHEIDEFGTLFYFDRTKNETVQHSIESKFYCVEHYQKNRNSGYGIFKSVLPEVPLLTTKEQVIKWLQVISCIFLLLTMFVYIVTKETSNLFGKILVCFCVALLTTFVVMIYLSIDLRKGTSTCYVLGFVFIYMVFSSFAWLNTMCIDIYSTFGAPKVGSSMHRKRKDLKRFILYSCYGWGYPFFLTGIIFLFNKYKILPKAIEINIGIKKCSIESNNYAEMVFKSTPLAILELANLYMFVVIIRYCLKVKSEIQQMNDTSQLQKKNKFEAYKERFGLLLKLSVIMGISFLFEIVSSFYDFKATKVTQYIEIIWDSINMLQGLFIFLIFICKKRIIEKLKIPIVTRRRISMSVESTRSSNISRTRSSKLVNC